MKRIRNILTIVLIFALVTGCGKVDSTTEEAVITMESLEESSPTDPYADVYMDDFAIGIVKEACQARWDRSRETEDDFNYILANYANDTDGRLYGDLKRLYTEYNQIEYDIICKYTSDDFNDRKFKDGKLKEFMGAYADAVKTQLEVGKQTDFSTIAGNDKYNKCSDNKCYALLNLIDNYDLTFDNEYSKYAELIKTQIEESTMSD